MSAFRDLVAAALPSEERLRARLAGLSPREWTGLAMVFAAGLPEFDGVVSLPTAVELAQALAQARGVPLLDLSVTDDVAKTLPPGSEVVLVTDHLAEGQAEADAATLASGRGLRVLGLAAAVERTSAGGRGRLEAQGVRLYAVLQLADTPGGLVFERRAPTRWRHGQE